ncbi:MAG: hypothetical protein MZW92_15280 [Comamonadaceae bacterium]|nr:hypothetical protein [Comamonadaceae bacterium]
MRGAPSPGWPSAASSSPASARPIHVTGWKVGYALRAARADGRIPQGAPVHRVRRQPRRRSTALAAYMDDAARHLRARRPSTRPSATSSARGLAGARASSSLPCAGTYFQLRRLRRDLATSPTPTFAAAPDARGRRGGDPVSAFYRRAVRSTACVRFCFAKSEETLAEAGRRLRRLAGRR